MSRPFTVALLALVGVGCQSGAADAPQAPTSALRQVQTVDLPGVEGRFDHFAADVKGQRLFVAALGNNTLEVIDTAGGKRVHSIAGLHKPTGVAFVPEAGRVVVAGGDDGTVRFYDAGSFELAATVGGLDDADNVRYDAGAKRLYVGYGSGALAVIDAAGAKKVADVKLDAHPESFQLEARGSRIFVNVPDSGGVAVVDRQKGAVVAKWPLNEARANFPMALDEGNRRLFVGCRQPARLLVLDTDSGKTVASVECAGDADDLFYDAARKRIYVSGGGGSISVIRQTDADRYQLLGSVQTAPGARTSIFVPDAGRLYLAVPHRGSQAAEIRVFEAER